MITLQLKYKSKSIVLIALLFCSLSLMAQISIKGKLVSAKTKQPVATADVSLFDMANKLITGTITDNSGNFEIKINEQKKVLLKISFIGFKHYQKNIVISTSTIDLGSILLVESDNQLDEVVIKDKQPLVTQNGDTTEMKSSAYKTNPESSASDLIQKMPGVTTDNGKLTVHGEEVKQVLVDGQEFFGDDVNGALQNIPSEVIEKIQVFDKLSDQSEFTGFNDGNTSKTLNIVTKRDRGKLMSGKIYAGYGTDDSYSAGAVYSKFSGKNRFSIIAQSNNINQQNFSTADLLGVMGDKNRGGGGPPNGRAGRRPGGSGGSPGGAGDPSNSNGGDLSNFLVNNQNGITKTQAIGINYVGNWFSKIKITGSYFFNYADNSNQQALFRQYVNNSDYSGQKYNENSVVQGTNINHRISLKINYQIDSLNSIQLRPKLTLQQNKGTSNLAGQTFLLTELNSLKSNYDSKLLGINYSGDFLYRHKFMLKGRTFSIGLSNGYNQKSGDYDQYSLTDYYTQPLYLDSLQQYTDLNNDGWSLSSNVSYTEPLGSYSGLLAEYRLGYQTSKSNKKSYDLDSITMIYSDLDTSLSNVFTTKYRTQSGGIGYLFNYNSVNLTVKLNYQQSELLNSTDFPLNSQTNKTFNTILPSLNFRYNVEKKKSFTVSYRASASNPTVDQLQNVINNTNSLQLTTGNPDLQQFYQHTVFVRYIANNLEKATNFFVLIGGGFSNNYIGNSTFYATKDTLLNHSIFLYKGTQLTMPQNLTGYYNMRSLVSYGIPVTLLKTNVNMNLSYTFSNVPALINGTKNIANQQVVSGGIFLGSNISQNFDFGISSNVNYSTVSNSLQKSSNSSYYVFTNKLRLNCLFGDGFVFQTDINHLIYKGLSNSLDTKYLLCNAAFGYKFLKNKAAEIKLSAYDILNQNQSLTRNTTELYTEDVSNNVLTRYFMLNFTYTIGRKMQRHQDN